MHSISPGVLWVLVKSEVPPTCRISATSKEGGQPAVKDTTSSPLKSMASTIASAASLMETSSSSPTMKKGMMVAVPPSSRKVAVAPCSREGDGTYLTK